MGKFDISFSEEQEAESKTEMQNVDLKFTLSVLGLISCRVTQLHIALQLGL